MAKKVIRPAFPDWEPPWHDLDLELYAPFGSLGAKKVLTLPLKDVRPTIRILRGDKKHDFYLHTRIIFDYLLLLFVDGEGRITIEKNEIEIQKRHLFVVPPFTPHSLAMKGVHTFISIHFDWKPQFPPRHHRLSGRQPYRIRLPLNNQLPDCRILAASDPLVSQIQQIVEVWQKQQDASRLRADAMLFEVIATLLERVQTKDPSSSQHAHVEQTRIEMAIALMEKNLAQDLTPEAMAQAAGLSSSHFSRLFRKWTGHSPMEHLLQLRIRKAKELLGDVHLTIKEVANLSGFKDPSYFSKIFMRLDGLPPSQYRDMALAQFKN